MRDLYIAMSGAVALERQLDIVSNNLANVNTAGYKRDGMAFESMLPQIDTKAIENSVSPGVDLPAPPSEPFGDKHFVGITGVYTVFEQGTIRNTGHNLDLAIEGDGFFVVETDEGERYTKAGNFTLNRDKELIGPRGSKVLGASGPIKLNSADFRVAEDGKIYIDGAQVDQLRLVRFKDQRALDKEGGNLFVLGDSKALPEKATLAEGVAIRQGFLEYSNVNMVDEMVKMIKIDRMYGYTQNAITAINDAARNTIQGMM